MRQSVTFMRYVGAMYVLCIPVCSIHTCETNVLLHTHKEIVSYKIFLNEYILRVRSYYKNLLS